MYSASPYGNVFILIGEVDVRSSFFDRSDRVSIGEFTNEDRYTWPRSIQMLCGCLDGSCASDTCYGGGSKDGSHWEDWYIDENWLDHSHAARRWHSGSP